MYEGYVKFGGVEVINADRLHTYVEAGLIPEGVTVKACDGDCDGLGEALGDAPYTTPAQDHPPWFDVADPDSLDFAGVVSLGFSGLSGSTRKTPMIETMRGGAIPGVPLPEMRTIAASALLVGRTSCSTEVGLSWLSNVLHQVCVDAVACRGTTLEMFTCCPAPVCDIGLVDPDSPLLPNVYATTPAPAAGFLVSGTTQAGTSFPVTAPTVATNLCTNPSFETNATGWTSPGTTGFLVSTLATNTEQAYVGGRSLKVTMPALAVTEATRVTYSLPTTIGQQYTISGRVYVPNAVAVPVRPVVLGIGAGERVVVKNQWAYFSYTFTATAASHLVGVETIANVGGTVTAGQFFYLDACWFYQGTGINTETFEDTNTTGWAGNTVFGTATPPTAIAATTEFAHTFARSMKVTWPTPVAPANNSTVVYDVSGLVTGKRYTFKVWVYVPAGSPDVQADAIFYAGSGFTSVKDAWVPLQVSFDGTADGHVFVAVTTYNPAMTTFCYVDDVQLLFEDGSHDYFDGDTPDAFLGQFTWTGTPHASTSTWRADVPPAMVAGPVQMPFDEANVTWAVNSITGQPWTVTPVLVSDDGGTTLQTGPTQTGTGAANIVTHLFPTPSENWRPALLVASPGAVITQVNVEHRAALGLADCVDPYRRTFSNVVCIDGPHVVDEVQAGCDAKLLRVEWTWAAGDPWRYGVDQSLVLNKTSDTAAAGFTAPNVAVGLWPQNAGVVTQAASACPLPVTTPCAADPCCATPVAPPTAPVATDPCIVLPTDYLRTVAQLNPGVVAANAEGALTITIVNGPTDKLMVRMRLWQDPTPDLSVPNECAFLWEATIPYIPASQTVTIDSVMQTTSVSCAGLTITDDPKVRGAYGGPFSFPVVACGKRYLLAMDTPRTYPTGKTCAGHYTAGQPQGTLTWNVDLALREG